MFKITSTQMRMKASEILASALTQPIIPLSAVKRPEVYRSFVKPIATDGYGFAAADIVLSHDGSIRLIEMNGSNAGATSFISPDGDFPRAKHFVETLSQNLCLKNRAVIIIGYAPKTGLLHEIIERACQVALLINDNRSCALRRATESLGSEEITVVVDDIPRIAYEMSRQDDKLFYRGIEVAGISNANIFPELVRRGIVNRSDTGYDIDVLVHDGPLVWLTHNRPAQQLIAAMGTGIEPQKHKIAYNMAECLEVIDHFHRAGIDVFGKINAGSGSVGVDIFPARITKDETKRNLLALIEHSMAIYGNSASQTIWPLCFFEATFSSNYKLNGENHLYDARFCCLISPGKIEIFPAEMRICPKAFNPEQINRDNVIANTTGRKPTADFIRCPLAIHSSGNKLEIHNAGISDEVFERILESAALWCEAAWHYSNNNAVAVK